MKKALSVIIILLIPVITRADFLSFYKLFKDGKLLDEQYLAAYESGVKTYVFQKNSINEWDNLQVAVYHDNGCGACYSVVSVEDDRYGVTVGFQSEKNDSRDDIFVSLKGSGHGEGIAIPFKDFKDFHGEYNSDTLKVYHFEMGKLAIRTEKQLLFKIVIQ